MITEMRALWLVEDCVTSRQNFKMADSRFVSVTEEMMKTVEKNSIPKKARMLAPYSYTRTQNN